MALELGELTQEVARNTTVDESVVTLVNGLADKLDEITAGGGSVAELQSRINALVAEMRGSTDKVASAVVARTPSAPGSPVARGPSTTS